MNRRLHLIDRRTGQEEGTNAQTCGKKRLNQSHLVLQIQFQISSANRPSQIHTLLATSSNRDSFANLILASCATAIVVRACTTLSNCTRIFPMRPSTPPRLNDKSLRYHHYRPGTARAALRATFPYDRRTYDPRGFWQIRAECPLVLSSDCVESSHLAFSRFPRFFVVVAVVAPFSGVRGVPYRSFFERTLPSHRTLRSNVPDCSFREG